jgi:hypothetical protein
MVSTMPKFDRKRVLNVSDEQIVPLEQQNELAIKIRALMLEPTF